MFSALCSHFKSSLGGFVLALGLSVWALSVQAQSLLPMPVEGAYGGILENNRVHDVVREQASSYNFLESLIYGIFSDENIIAANVVFGVIAILYFVVIGIRFILSQGNEEEIQNAQKHFGYMIIGLFIISIAQIAGFVVFNPDQSVNPDYLVNTNIHEVVYAKARQIKIYVQVVIGGIALLSIITSAFRIMSSTGNEEVISKEKQLLFNFFFATVLILAAEIIVTGVFYLPGANREGVTNQAITIGLEEIMGLVLTLISLVGAAGVIMLIMAGLYYVISFGDEERTGRAKQLIISTIIALVVIFSAYTILRIFF